MMLFMIWISKHSKFKVILFDKCGFVLFENFSEVDV